MQWQIRLIKFEHFRFLLTRSNDVTFFHMENKLLINFKRERKYKMSKSFVYFFWVEMC